MENDCTYFFTRLLGPVKVWGENLLSNIFKASLCRLVHKRNRCQPLHKPAFWQFLAPSCVSADLIDKGDWLNRTPCLEEYH